MTKSKIRIFKMENSRVYYTPNAFIPIMNTSLAGKNVQFAPNTYWEVEINKYDAATEEIEVKVTDFRSTAINAFKVQTTSVQLNSLKFEHLAKSYARSSDSEFEYLVNKQVDYIVLKQPIEIEEQEEKHQISYSLKDLDFQNGKVNLTLNGKHIPGILQDVQVTIPNPASIEQLNAIKPYIIKSLGSELVTVHVQLKRKGPRVYGITGHSDELGKINEQLIEKAQYDYLVHMIASSPANHTTSFSPEEFGEQLNLKINPVKTLDFLRDLNQVKKALHFEHIEYLCVRQNDSFPIRFITAPAFAFLLVIEARNSFYAVLECYDKPLATYIWRYSKTTEDIKTQLKQVYAAVEKEVVKAGKRASYIKDKPDNFVKVEHNYKALNGAQLWQQEMESILL
ncbi:hypothetical protein H7F15_01410 [Pontibacter sp. Tf4]|uniref:hypothetical protein n=1 Tax=Pontibacter sp. Tf4 TaxID=2761620 RepID=UPI001628B389|nr:hypothetical protein [Pontibacter sp. Tf4]MBB6609683.1 hypothetical protein [Pontibacter sp. Tf4]